MPMSNLIARRPQITLELASKDVEEVVFQGMKKSFQFGKVSDLVFIFSVTSKVRIYENLKNVFQEAVGKQFSQAEHHKKSDIVKNHLQHSLNLSSKNVKDAFFEYMTKHRSENGATFVTFTFTLLFVDLVISNPLYGLAPQLITTDSIYAELEDSSEESKEPEKDNPPPIPWSTHPSRRAISNPLCDLAPQLITKEKSLLKRAMGSFKKCFARKSLPISQARSTLHAFDSGFECSAGSENFKGPLNVSRNKDLIYTEIENSKKRNFSEDSGYETIPSPRASIRSTFSDSDYETSRRVEPAIYLEVLP